MGGDSGEISTDLGDVMDEIEMNQPPLVQYRGDSLVFSRKGTENLPFTPPFNLV